MQRFHVLSCAIKQMHPIFIQWCAFAPCIKPRVTQHLGQLELRWLKDCICRGVCGRIINGCLLLLLSLDCRVTLGIYPACAFDVAFALQLVSSFKSHQECVRSGALILHLVFYFEIGLDSLCCSRVWLPASSSALGSFCKKKQKKPTPNYFDQFERMYQILIIPGWWRLSS